MLEGLLMIEQLDSVVALLARVAFRAGKLRRVKIEVLLALLHTVPAEARVPDYDGSEHPYSYSAQQVPKASSVESTLCTT